MFELSLPTLLNLWVVLVIFVIFKQLHDNNTSCGLLIMYVAVLSLDHLFGAAIHTLPWYSTWDTPFVEAGFRESAYGFVSLLIGAFIIAPWVCKVLNLARAKHVDRGENSLYPKAVTYLGIGMYLIAGPLVSKIPTIRVLTYAGWSCFIVGVCLSCWKYWHDDNRKEIYFWVAMTACFPFFTIGSYGFIGMGILGSVVIIVFLLMFYKPRVLLLVILMLSVYLYLSLFVTYMRDRQEIRGMVSEKRSLVDRYNRVIGMMKEFELLDLRNENHLHRIDDRMNQNTLIGQSMESIRAGVVDYAHGETIWASLLALVPRILWANKSVFAGAGSTISKYTGVDYGFGTSVGIEPILECYINFGHTGVMIGLCLLGMILRIIDVIAKTTLKAGDWKRFTLYMLFGVTLCQSTGSFVDMTMGIGAAVFYYFVIIKHGIRFIFGKKFIE